MHSEKWFVEQYNRNRLPKEWVKDYKEFTSLMNVIKEEYGGK